MRNVFRVISMDSHALAWLGKRSLNNCRIFSQLVPCYEVRAPCKIGYKNCVLLSQPDNCIVFCLLNTTHYCTTLFQELLKKVPMVMILSVFLTLSSYSLTICDAIRSYSRNDNRHRATLSHNFRFISEKDRKRVSYPCLCNIKLFQNKLIPRSHQSLNMFKSCLVKHGIKLFTL